VNRSNRIVDLVVGARPNFVKAASLYRALDRSPNLKARVIHTGQHYDVRMSDVFFRDLELPEPAVHLGVGSGSHGAQTGRTLELYESHLFASRPCGVIVLGDVNSTLACALAAAKMGIPIAHVEAGLRSFDNTMPEEINRRLVDALASDLFVTESAGVENLLREGARQERIHLVGNVMADTLLTYRDRVGSLRTTASGIAEGRPYVLMTLHRPGNVDNPLLLERLMRMVLKATEDVVILFPAHPRTKNRLDSLPIDSLLQDYQPDKLRLIEPVSYLNMLALISQALVVITDSGGMQAETSLMDVPCLTLRETTEQPVTVELGTNTIIGHSERGLTDSFQQIRAGTYRRVRAIPLWDGRSSERIAAILEGRW
jgi:UDP-N-acetylglucosamine 2-epimerase (non-hydrolysing)